ncbi:MAG: hypothetical protein ACI9VN_000346, partial [Patescibacteria group bacterium]
SKKRICAAEIICYNLILTHFFHQKNMTLFKGGDLKPPL